VEGTDGWATCWTTRLALAFLNDRELARAELACVDWKKAAGWERNRRSRDSARCKQLYEADLKGRGCVGPYIDGDSVFASWPNAVHTRHRLAVHGVVIVCVRERTRWPCRYITQLLYDEGRALDKDGNELDNEFLQRDYRSVAKTLVRSCCTKGHYYVMAPFYASAPTWTDVAFDKWVPAF
jgi:hypothetical protein